MKYTTFQLTPISLAIKISALLAVSTPAWAAGPNTTTPAPPPVSPAPVITSQPQLSIVGAGGCTQQYTDAIDSLNAQGIIANDVGLAANAVGATAAVVGLAANVTAAIVDGAAQSASSLAWGIGGAAMDVGGVGLATGVTVVALPVAAVAGGAGMVAGGVAMNANTVSRGAQAAATVVKIVALGAEGVGVASTVTGVGSQIAAQVFAHQSQDLSVYSSTLPGCESTHTGTVMVNDGGVNVTGTSIFNNDVGVAANVNVEGNVNASQVRATQGISAVGGGIWIGDPNGTTYSDGITIGGGALSGAGVGGSQAITGDADAIAIGNNAQSMSSGSVALGLDASSTAADAVAVGTNAQSTMNGSVALGHDASSAGTDAIAVGTNAQSTMNGSVALGLDASSAGTDAIAVGTNAQANATGSAAYGQGAVANLSGQQVFGTQANTYTTPGITSDLSRFRQTGPLDVATSDVFGNMATDGGEIFTTLSENQAGIAIAMSLKAPQLGENEKFGIGFNWGMFQKSQAFSFSAAGVIRENASGNGARISLDAGLGLSLREKSFGGRNAGTNYGARVGIQISW